MIRATKQDCDASYASVTTGSFFSLTMFFLIASLKGLLGSRDGESVFKVLKPKRTSEMIRHDENTIMCYRETDLAHLVAMLVAF